ncbi:MmcQ/YjbR family DNA-binding protein [Bosea sp. (in: a-proteobacteria)]|uniref:MmcQ/YjbR family DNA-binding protein n=1 Tax=Bosea sp. (in: a-proteobacteria) TaxID=1871050 RepID=UPI001204ABBA|nr:MmcQ/YjbR family DNA-binding protein [Bosea sp. (in: a-proteobacteria)]TAJ29038.1 MAG: MmcQ/YjbR family DNA-binding protein [Bosea sp. (in: a-proteobacteria)]
MSPQAYDGFCASLPATRRVVQWGDAIVWKVAGKVFAIGRVQEGGEMAASFKCSPMAFDILAVQPGLRPAPYLASRGMKWIQWLSPDSMPDDALQDYLRESHRLVAAGLTRRARAELGL